MLAKSIMNNSNSQLKGEIEKPLTKPLDDYQKYKDFQWQKPDMFKNGPIDDESRSCRDIFCLVIFFIFIGGCFAVAVIGFKEGNPELILYPYDEDGNQCGINTLKEYKFVYFYKSKTNIQNLNTSNIANAICIKSCPNQTITEESADLALDCYPTNNNPNCWIQRSNYYTSKECKLMSILSMNIVINRFCLPIGTRNNINEDNSKEEEDGASSANQLFNMIFSNTDRLIIWMGDLYTTWLALFASLFWSFIIALVFLVIVRFCAGFMIYSTIVLILGGFIALGVFCHKKANEPSYINDSILHWTMIALAICCYVVSGIWLLYIIFMCNRIRLAVNLMSAAAKYIGQNFCIVVVPIIFLVFSGLYYAYWIYCSIYLYSAGEVYKSSSLIANMKWSSKTRYAWWYHMFSLIYIHELIRAISEFVYASSACIWYFTHEKETREGLIKKSFERVFRYHFGSLAFGALIITIIKFIMFFTNFFKRRIDNTRRNNGKIGRCFKCLLCCCKCCLQCVARALEFINHHAYIQIALKGDSFCVSAWEGFGLIIRNMGRFSTLHLIGGFFNLFGIVFIAIASGLIGYVFITEVEYFYSDLNSPVIPTFVSRINIIQITIIGDDSNRSYNRNGYHYCFWYFS